MKIGARSFKSGLAVTIALFLADWLGLEAALGLTGFVTFVSMQNSVKGSLGQVISRIVGSIIGGAVAIFMVYFFGNSYILVGVALVLVISILHALDLDDVIGISGITLIVIMMSNPETIIQDATVRVLGTIIGVLTAFVVNQLVMPPKYDDNLYRLVVLQTDEILKQIRAALRKNTQYATITKDLEVMAENENRMKNLFDLMRDDVSFKIQNVLTPGRDDIARARTLVVYRQLIKTQSAGRVFLKTIINNQNVFNDFPRSLQVLTRERMETLTTAHEQILLKFTGKIPAHQVQFAKYETDLKKNFINQYFTQAADDKYFTNNEDNPDASNAVIHIMSSLFKYEEEVNRLNRLVSSYRKYHADKRQTLDDNVTSEV